MSKTMKYIRILFWLLLICNVLYCLYKFFATYIEFNTELDKLEAQLNAHEHFILVNLPRDQRLDADEKFINKLLNVKQRKNEFILISEN